ncbi:MAG: exodeoxyribonuclease VII large subunit [Planctomycetota bacterium]
MERLLEFDAESGDLQIRFPYAKELVAVVRGLPGRRWNPTEKLWTVPQRHLEDVAKVLLPQGFVASEGVQELLSDREIAIDDFAEQSLPGLAGGLEAGSVDGGAGNGEPQALSISQLNEQVRELLRSSFRMPIWVHGEVVGFERNAHKHHVYFQLADKADGDDRPRGVVTAVLFASERRTIEQRLAAAVEPFELSDGIKIQVRARVDLYPPSGSYQIVVEDIDPNYTLGAIALRQEQILREIDRLGIRDHNRSLPFARPTLRLALVTSYESDAYNDVINELAQSEYSFAVDVYDCHVQGARVEEDVLAALDHVSVHADDYDVIAIVRGGGSRTDLMAFDSLPLALAVARHPLKVVVGIGHHRDRSVLDVLAHSEKTPTAIAQQLVALARAEEQELLAAVAALSRQGSGVLHEQRSRLVRAAELFRSTAQLRIERAAAQLGRDVDGIRLGIARAWEREKQRLRGAAAAAGRGAERVVDGRRAELLRAVLELRNCAERQQRRARERLERLQLRADAADPKRILQRGYAWLQKDDGTSLKAASQVASGDRFTARLADGSVAAEVTDVDP